MWAVCYLQRHSARPVNGLLWPCQRCKGGTRILAAGVIWQAAERIRICFKLRQPNGHNVGRGVPNIALHGSA